mmetsp:Transcript_13937/g.37207  ORF Transcript_13937/g.37207 Transcript_13937/m.37207 type:complete len:293 (-) Transcript_13937:11-889(-)
MADTEAPFAIGEKVFVPHTDKYYEAKVLKSEYRGQGGWYYFLHYNGWNKKYDEWVEAVGLVKADQAAAVGALNAQPKSKKGAGGGAAARQPAAAATTSAVPMGVPVSMLPTPNMGRAQRQAHPKQQTTAAAPTSAGPAVGLDIEVPPLLKKYLVEDFEQVAEGGKLVPLPRNPCVAELMDRYVAEAKTGRTGSVDAEEEVAHGLMTYFDKALPVMLLYRNERDQAADALADGQMPRAVYGAEHLSRLMVKLPDIIPLGLLTDDQLATVATMVQDVMLWMADNTGSLFLPKDG